MGAQAPADRLSSHSELSKQGCKVVVGAKTLLAKAKFLEALHASEFHDNSPTKSTQHKPKEAALMRSDSMPRRKVMTSIQSQATMPAAANELRKSANMIVQTSAASTQKPATSPKAGIASQIALAARPSLGKSPA